jgi:hypothetical protein
MLFETSKVVGKFEKNRYRRTASFFKAYVDQNPLIGINLPPSFPPL